MTARRRRSISAIAISAAVHAAVLTVVWLQKPTLAAFPEPGGPPEAVIPVLILPRTPPPAAGARVPAPIRLHRRAQRFSAEPSPVAPLQVPEKKIAAQALPLPAPSTAPPAPLTAEVRTTLRLGLVGCANADAVGLSREEREDCDRQMAARGKDMPYLLPPMSGAKRAALAASAARKEADYRYKRSPPTPTRAAGTGGPGQTAEDLGAALGNDRPKATLPF